MILERFVTLVNTLLFILGCVVEIGTLLLVTQGPMLQEDDFGDLKWALVSFAVGWLMMFAGVCGCRVVRTRQKKCILAYAMVIVFTLFAEAWISFKFYQYSDILTEASDLQDDHSGGKQPGRTVRKPLEKFHSGFKKQFEKFQCMLVTEGNCPEDEAAALGMGSAQLTTSQLAVDFSNSSSLSLEHGRRLPSVNANPQCDRKLQKLYDSNKSTCLIHCWAKEKVLTNFGTPKEGHGNHHAEAFEWTVNRVCTAKTLADGATQYEGMNQKEITQNFIDGCQHCTRKYGAWITKEQSEPPPGWGDEEVNQVFCRCFARLLDSIERHTSLLFISAGIFAGIELLLLLSMVFFYCRKKDQFHDQRISYIVEEDEDGIEIAQRPANWG